MSTDEKTAYSGISDDLKERREQEAKEGIVMRRIVKWTLTTLFVVAAVLGVAYAGVAIYKDSTKLHYMYSECEDINVRRESTCHRRWVVYPDGTQVRQHKVPTTGKWMDSGRE